MGINPVIWNIDAVKIHVPDVYQRESVLCPVSSHEIVRNTGKVQYVFMVEYNGGVIAVDDYYVTNNGYIIFDLPVGLKCTLYDHTFNVEHISDHPVKVITVRWLDNTGQNLECDYTFGEIVDFLKDGYIVIARYMPNNNVLAVTYLFTSYTAVNNEVTEIYFKSSFMTRKNGTFENGYVKMTNSAITQGVERFTGYVRFNVKKNNDDKYEIDALPLALNTNLENIPVLLQFKDGGTTLFGEPIISYDTINRIYKTQNYTFVSSSNSTKPVETT